MTTIINTNTTGLVGNEVAPRRCTMLTTDSLATITAVGYLNKQNLSGNTILNNDIFDVIYNYVPSTGDGDFGTFLASASSAGFTLEGGGVLGTAAYMNASNSSLDSVVAIHAPSGVTIGDIPKFYDNAGSIVSAGFSIVYGVSTQWNGAGSSSHDFPCPGIKTAITNLFITPIQNNSSATILQATSGADDTITVTYSGTPGGAQNISYLQFITG